MENKTRQTKKTRKGNTSFIAEKQVMALIIPTIHGDMRFHLFSLL
jgi:hypothetical protein